MKRAITSNFAVAVSLLDYLRANLLIDIQHLRDKFSVSTSTIRHDLAALEQ